MSVYRIRERGRKRKRDYAGKKRARRERRANEIRQEVRGISFCPITVLVGQRNNGQRTSKPHLRIYLVASQVSTDVIT